MREERTLRELLGRPDRLDLIALDELGYVPFSKAGAELANNRSRRMRRAALPTQPDMPGDTVGLGGLLRHYRGAA